MSEHCYGQQTKIHNDNKEACCPIVSPLWLPVQLDLHQWMVLYGNCKATSGHIHCKPTGRGEAKAAFLALWVARNEARMSCKQHRNKTVRGCVHMQEYPYTSNTLLEQEGDEQVKNVVCDPKTHSVNHN